METGALTEALGPAAKSVEVEPKHEHEVAIIQHQKILELHALDQALTHKVAILRVAQVSGVTKIIIICNHKKLLIRILAISLF